MTAMQTSDRHLVWTRGLRGPSPQIFHTPSGALPTLSDGERSRALTTPRKLTEQHDGMSLAQIAALHPAPPPREDA